jgi:hypothetical protein
MVAVLGPVEALPCYIHILVGTSEGKRRHERHNRNYATSRKMAVSIPDEVIGFFN